MALLVTIGNICILGNFQLGIWGKIAKVIISSCKVFQMLYTTPICFYPLLLNAWL